MWLMIYITHYIYSNELAITIEHYLLHILTACGQYMCYVSLSYMFFLRTQLDF